MGKWVRNKEDEERDWHLLKRNKWEEKGKR